MEKKISTDLAIEELKGFLRPHKKKDFKRGLMTDENIKEDYPDVIEAIEDGNLIFENNNAVYTLENPVLDTEKNVAIGVIRFRNRIHPVDRFNVMNGIQVSKEQGTYVLKLLSLATQVSITELSKIDKYDFEVLNQVASVF